MAVGDSEVDHRRERKKVEEILEATENDLLLFMAGPSKVVNQSLANLAFISARSWDSSYGCLSICMDFRFSSLRVR
jgi:hypothetical protein